MRIITEDKPDDDKRMRHVLDVDLPSVGKYIIDAFDAANDGELSGIVVLESDEEVDE